VTSYGDCGTATAVAAGTETLVATINILPEGTYRIVKVIIAGAIDAAGESVAGFVELKIDKVSGPFKFPFGKSGSITSGAACDDAEEIEVDIPVPGSAQVKIYVTTVDPCDIVAGIVYTD